MTQVTYSGRLWWGHRMFNPDTFKDKTTWNVQFYPDDVEPFYELQRQGMKNTIKKDENGYNLKISREVTKATSKGVISFEPPKVTLNGEAYNGPVPNGSKANITIQIREHSTPLGKKAKAIRLVGADITELFEEPKEQFSEF